MFYKKYLGFSLLEALTCLSIISIIYLYTIPYFHNYMAKIESSKVQNIIISGLSSAKNHASIYKSNVVVCSSFMNSQCQKNQWNNQIIIFIDINQNKQIDDHEKIILQESLTLKYGSLEWRGTLSSPTLTFMAKHNGLPIGSNGSFYYCSFHDLPNKRIILSKMGHIRIENSKNC